MMPKILLVEDAKECQLLVRELLARFSEVQVASTLAEAHVLLKEVKFDLILLDLSLPDGDGMEFFSLSRSRSAIGEVPVIFLTAKNDAASQATAFSLDADDYIIKPFKPIEFRARIESRLRRLKVRQKAETSLKKGALRIDLETQKAFVAGQMGESELDLTGREFKLLWHLSRHEDTLFSRDQLISSVWGTGVHVMDRTVDTHIHSLRKKLGVYSAYIESEIGRGYRFNSAAQISAQKKGKQAA